MWLIIVLLIFVTVLLFYVHISRKLKYWSKLGVPHLPPDFLIGNLRGFQTKFKLSALIKRIYNETKGLAPIAGFYAFTDPACIVLDLDLLKHVFVKDFEYFSERGLYYNERDDPLSANLVTLPLDEWKPLRSKFSATFQTTRLKSMHPIFQSVAEKLHHYVKGRAGGEIDISETCKQFTIQLILETVYGIEGDCIGKPENIFCRVAPSIMTKSKWEIIKDLFLIMFPNLSRKLRLKFFRQELVDFFTKLSDDTMKYRETNEREVLRHDFMALLMKMHKSEEVNEVLTKDQVAAEAFIFFFGGFETTALTMAYVLYELALHQEIQERLREEIGKVYKEHNHSFNYEALQEMPYLNQVINETLRKYPPLGTVFRQVAKDYQIPNSTIVLRRGQKIFVPVNAIHSDPQLYPDSDKFEPERFTKENIAARHPYAWIPFGAGPRHCIGIRYAMHQEKIGIVTLLHKFRVRPGKRTKAKMEFKLNRQILEPLENISLHLEVLQNG